MIWDWDYQLVQPEVIKTVTIMVGLPGSGKTTWAIERMLRTGGTIVSADHFFETAEGDYVFVPSKIAEAHAACLASFLGAINVEAPHIIVDNTNVSQWERANYETIAKMMDYRVGFKCMHFSRPNDTDLEYLYKRQNHGVPMETLRRMRDRLEIP